MMLSENTPICVKNNCVIYLIVKIFWKNDGHNGLCIYLFMSLKVIVLSLIRISGRNNFGIYDLKTIMSGVGEQRLWVEKSEVSV